MLNNFIIQPGPREFMAWLMRPYNRLEIPANENKPLAVRKLEEICRLMGVPCPSNAGFLNEERDGK